MVKRIDMAPENIPILIIACYTIHNICKMHGDEFNDEWMSDERTSTTTNDESTHFQIALNNLAEVTRNAFVNYFDQL